MATTTIVEATTMAREVYANVTNWLQQATTTIVEATTMDTAHEHTTPSVFNAAALIAAGAHYLGLADAGAGCFVFRFRDPDGEWRREEKRIRLHCARPVQPQALISALSGLRTELREAKQASGTWVDRLPVAR